MAILKLLKKWLIQLIKIKLATIDLSKENWQF